MGQAPSGILKLNDALKANAKRPKSYKFSGIVGDSAHGYGYHLSPNDLNHSDYSLQTSRDKAGAKTNPNYASAWDLNFNPADMKTVTERLLKACKENDPRVSGIREFCGTRDGRNTYPWDHHDNSSEGIGSWDDSHLWHVHISFYRDVCNNYEAIKGVVDVICGIPAVAAKPAPPKPYVPPKFPLSRVSWFSQNKNNKGNNVLLIQKRLQKLGFAPTTAGWADGIYGPQTTAAVKKYQKSIKWKRQTGVVSIFTWNPLFGVK